MLVICFYKAVLRKYRLFAVPWLYLKSLLLKPPCRTDPSLRAVTATFVVVARRI
jgi:hypothetical protein